MRLKCIRLAGFKSFVDPTTVQFPSNMSAVVGPNGCGKSNIIDAVRWVMGESSAKNLRGESMTDVIFNGSNSRKPVGQASIELVFDNSDNSLVGEYAAFAEISIRRKVTREGQNTYYLNGTKCRRRDITDIFLGTGLGPRSYSIIEQGMISKLIEARPEDLRHFIEEAAGISKYKERRRETENRIRRTQENLARLSDLREELERQLERLQRQAQSAQRYQEYKAQERLLKAQLSALKWQELNQQAGNREAQIAEQAIAFEALQAVQRSADAAIESLRDGHHELSERFNQVQGRFYSVGADIARIEQSIAHGQTRLRQLQDDLREAERQRQESEVHLQGDRHKLALLDEELALLEPQQEECAAAAEDQAQHQHEADEALNHWQQRWDQLAQCSAAPRQSAERAQARIEQLSASLVRWAERQRKLAEELDELGLVDEIEQASLAQHSAELTGQHEDLQSQELTLIEQLDQRRSALEQQAQEVQQLQLKTQRLSGRMASLETLQQAALNPNQEASHWLTEQGLAQCLRLAQTLQVTPGWERAVETVLGADVQGIVLSDDALPAALPPHSTPSLLSLQPEGLSDARTLLSQVRSDWDLSPWLGQVYLAESLQQAWAQRVELQPGQSLITQEGYWLGRHFLRVAAADNAQAGVLERAQELNALTQEYELDAAALEQANAALDELRQLQQADEQQREALRDQLQTVARQLAEVQARYSALCARAEQQQLARQRLQAEFAEAQEQQALEAEQCAEAKEQLEQAQQLIENDSDQRDQLSAERERLKIVLEQARQSAQHSQSRLNQLAIKLSTLRAQREATVQALARLAQQLERHDQRGEQLKLNLEEGQAPLEELKMQLEDHLERRLAVDDELRSARHALEDADRALREEEKRRTQAEQQAQLLRSQIEQQRMNWQELDVRRKALVEQLSSDGYQLHEVLALMPADAECGNWQEQLEQLSLRIARLGPINLAAIDEYQQQAQRKNYLDAQNADLCEALTTLEQVIGKIDRQTRERFKDTFEQINNGLQALFPKVFGGGQAYLQLTGEDLLDTGVAIMARPPGKKNSTIHLLSGGEKALTALALVFAIFQLNPAPFCMLDEVDAPLDDANVGRYAKLVKEMSASVQFIYITHNKIAMEMADQLMGVTMHEPGCSRLVAVDVEQALSLVES